MVGRTTPLTKADVRRGEIIREICCICCAIERRPGVPCQVHHLLAGNRRGHQYTLGLCPWHHEGVVPFFSVDVKKVAAIYGPSLRHNSKAFHDRYGDDDELLAIQNAAIRIVESAHRRGEYVPDVEISHLVRLLWREVVLGKPPSASNVIRAAG